MNHVLWSCPWTKLAGDGLLQLYSANDIVIWLRHMTMKHSQNNYNNYVGLTSI